MAAYLIWFLVGLAFILLELASPLFISVFFGLGCWITALVEGLFGVNITAQFGIFAVSTVLCLVFLRRYAKRLLPSRDEHEGEDELVGVGEVVAVTRDIPCGGEGEIKFRGSYWRATSERAAPAGAMVRITGVKPGQKMTLVVEPLEEGGSCR